MSLGAILFVATQFWLPATGLPTLYFTSTKSKWAPFFGLLGQPAWLYAAVYTRQWGLLVLTMAYTILWVVTACKWWSKKEILGNTKP